MTKILRYDARINLCGIYGRPASGKSTLVKDIVKNMYDQKCFDYCMVITGTIFNKFYNFVGGGMVYDAKKILTDPPKIKVGNKTETLNAMDLAVAKLMMTSKKLRKRKFLLILDDISGANFQTFIMKQLINNHRHYNIHILIATQTITDVPVSVRNNMNFAFLCKPVEINAIKQMTRSFNISESEQEFLKKLDEACKEQYYFLVVDKDVNKYAKYKAKLIKNFKIKNTIK